MPHCIYCQSYDKVTKSCQENTKSHRGREDSPVRKCINTIIRKTFEEYDIKGKKVLEVGAGQNRAFRYHTRKNKSKYYSLQPRKKRGTTHQGKANEATEIFDSNFFDVIYAGQTAEHWGDTKTIIQSLQSLYQVLKPNGYLFINVPIFSHGNKIFILYQEQEIINCLNMAGEWQSMQLEKWRYNYEPLAPFPVRKRASKKIKQISTQAEPSIWILEIKLKK